MKMLKTFKRLLITMLTLALILVSFVNYEKVTVKADTIVGTIPVYRLYCPVNGEHLYTTSFNETKALYQSGWGYEGVGWYACSTGTPVYRLYNSGLKNHLYTVDLNEANTLVKNDPTYWHWDNNKKPVFYSNGFIPIYRVYNKGLSGMHHLTTDANEYKTLPKYGWTQEGCSIYAGSKGAQVQTRYYKDNKNLTQAANNTSGNYSGSGSNYTISNTSSYATIEADMKLEGTGTGSHAKLVICTSTAAVSFGLQYDQCAAAPYTGKTMFILENVESNANGGQTYTRPGNQVGSLGTTYHVMLTINKDGSGSVYINKKKVGDYKNKTLGSQMAAGNAIYLRVEGSGRKNGDKVTATFTNIKQKIGTYSASKSWGTHEFRTCSTMKATKITSSAVTISGYISGLRSDGDWDNQYGVVSSIVQFVE